MISTVPFTKAQFWIIGPPKSNGKKLTLVMFTRDARSLRQIAAELNARGVKTARGGKWHATTVRNILEKRSQATSSVAA